MIRRAPVLTLAILATITLACSAQKPASHATLVYAMGREPTVTVPLFTGSREENEDVADQLFLHLAVFAPNAKGTADAMMVPALAKAWHRIDPLTLVFDIDPRARWHDGTPVTAHDVIFTWGLATSPKLNSDARLEPIASVEAVGTMSVRVRFKRPSVEQVYTFGFLIQPLPAHLLEKLAPESISTSDFAQHPSGDGPYRFERKVAGQSIELRADTAFFLGRPTISRLLLRTIVDPTARVNAFVSGETDVLDKIPVQSLPQVQQHAGGRVIDPGSNVLVYMLFNTRSATDSGRPHPILSDPRVREALTLALDRNSIAQATFGPAAHAVDAAQSQLWGWITPGAVATPAFDAAKA
ncbi:MAG: ABC transporter substrate-binding protein, partial [Gemmatimonadota bacterium]